MKCGKNATWLFIIIITALMANVAQTDIARAQTYDPADTKVSVDYHGRSQIINTALGVDTEFEVNITVNYIEELWAYQIKLGESDTAVWKLDPVKYQGWNASVLNLIKAENGPFLGSAGGKVDFDVGDINSTQGTLSLTIGALDPPRKLPTGGGTLVTLTFKVVGIGSSPIHFSRDSGLLNKTEPFFQFGGVWLRGTPPPPPKPGELPLKHPDFLVDGYFDNRPSVRVDPPLVKGIAVGNNFTVNIDVINITRLHSWAFSMKWNATLLNATGVTAGNFLNSSFDPGEINNTAGEINDVSASLTGTEEVAGTGTLASLTFDVMDTGTSGLNFSNIELYNSAGEAISVGITNGFFTNLKTHEMEVTGVTVNPARVKEGSGQPILIDAVVTNTGSFNETDINVTAYYDGIEIGNQTIQLLTNETFSDEFPSYNYTTTVTFQWDTTNVGRGKYRISVEAVSENATASSLLVDVVIYAYDIAVTEVTTPVATVFSGSCVNVTVEVKNLGTEPETFNVTAYYDGNEIDRLLVTDLDYKESETLEFVWNTTGVALGNYTIKAEATGPFVQDEDEEDRANNLYVMPGEVTVKLRVVESLSLGFILLITVPIAAVAAIVVLYLYRKRRKPPEVID